jgi:tetratricopeptide (TPR) repeat protein
MFFIACVFPDIVIDPRMDMVVHDLLNQRYRKAHENVEAILQSDPDNMDALFMRLNAFQIEIIDYESYMLNGYTFVASVDSVLTFFDKFIQPADEKEQAKLLFYKGTLYGMKALVLAKVGEWTQALKYAREYMGRLKEARELDITLYEVSYGIGLYNYYVGHSLKWIPFMGSKSRKGIREIASVARSMSPMRYMAIHSLSWIYIERGEYEKVDALVSPVLAKYPNNTIYLGIKARASLLRERYEDALSTGRRLAELSRARNPVNWTDLLGGYQIMTACLDLMGKREECLQVIHEALALKVPASAKKIEYVQKHLDFIAIKKRDIEEKQ